MQMYIYKQDMACHNKNAFGQRPTACFVIEIQALTIGFWNDLDLKNHLGLDPDDHFNAIS